MRWLWLLLVASVSAENFCFDYGNEVEDTLQAMQRVLEVFFRSPFSVSADVVLGLKIAETLMGKIPPNHGWVTEVENMRVACQKIIRGYLGGKFGQHVSSQNLIPFMLNSSLWDVIIREGPGRNLTGFPNFPPNDLFLIRETSDECFLNLFQGNCLIDSTCFGVDATPNRPKFETTHFLMFLQISAALNCGEKLTLNLKKSQICGNMYQNLKESLSEPKPNPDIDILLEEICLCGLEGFEEFSSRKIQRFVKYHEDYGCFFPDSPNKPRMKKTDTLTAGKCHSHTNAVGFATLALFLKTLITKCKF